MFVKAVASIAITGPTEVNEGSTTQYQANVVYNDGSVRSMLTAEMDQWAVSGNATITQTGSMVAPSVTADTAVTITLTATVDQQQFTDTHVVTVKDVAPIPVSVAILGLSTVNENSTNSYTAQITMSDGSKVTPDTAVFSLTSGVGSVSSSGTAVWPKVMANSTSKIHVIATYGGKTFTADLTVTIANLGNIVSVALSGPTSINEGSTGTYKMVATNEDGSTTNFTTPTLTFVSATSAASISGQVVTAKSVTADTVVRLKGTITAESKSWEATMDITIKDVPVTLSALSITGASSVQENTTSQYTAVATFSDGTTQNVTPTWSIAANGGLTGVAVSTSGLLTAPEVTADTAITIAASYTYSGITKSATKSVTITNVAASASKPRFGIISRINSEAKFNAAFLASLTTVLTGKTADNIYMPANASTSSNNKYGYVAMPKASCGYAYVRQLDGSSYGFAGSWDGAKDYPDAWDFTGPWEGTINGEVWVVYRNDFPFENLDYTFEFRYNSSSPMSGVA